LLVDLSEANVSLTSLNKTFPLIHRILGYFYLIRDFLFPVAPSRIIAFMTFCVVVSNERASWIDILSLTVARISFSEVILSNISVILSLVF